MGKDIRNTKKQEEFFAIIGDLSNPSAQMMGELFSPHKDSPAKFAVDDIISIGPNEYPGVKPNSITTIGLYIFNKFLIEPLKVFGYINKPIDNEVWNTIEALVAEGCQADDIPPDAVAVFIDRTQYLLGGPLSHLINPSLSSSVMVVPPKAELLKQKLFRENKDKLDANDPIVSSEIAKSVVKEALTEIKDAKDPGISLFDSGAIDPYNNYRTMFVMKGAIRDNTGESPTGYKVVKSNYNTGVSKDDVPLIADSLVTGAYYKGVATQDSGASAKRTNTLMQHIRLDKPGSDCKTTRTLKTLITSRHLYRNIVVNGKIINLTPDVIGKYKGKVCDMRSPIYCKAPDPKYCNTCVGDRLYRIGVHNVGSTISIMNGSTLNLSLKSFHDVSIKYYDATVDDLLKYVK